MVPHETRMPKVRAAAVDVTISCRPDLSTKTASLELTLILSKDYAQIIHVDGSGFNVPITFVLRHCPGKLSI
jgi:hypothetical protein